MINGVNIEEIKQYNASIRAYKEKSSSLAAEIKFNTQELENICTELTRELGVVVTPENVEQIYNEKIASITETLKSGTEIINRIEQETREQDNPVGQPVVNRPSMGTPVIGGQIPNQSVFGGAPTNMESTNASLFSDLPPMFKK